MKKIAFIRFGDIYNQGYKDSPNVDTSARGTRAKTA